MNAAEQVLLNAKARAAAESEGLQRQQDTIFVNQYEQARQAAESLAELEPLTIDPASFGQRINAARAAASAEYDAAAEARQAVLNGLETRLQALRTQDSRRIASIASLAASGNRAEARQAKDQGVVIAAELAKVQLLIAQVELTYNQRIAPVAGRLAAEVEAIAAEFEPVVLAYKTYLDNARSLVFYHVQASMTNANAAQRDLYVAQDSVSRAAGIADRAEAVSFAAI